MMKVVLLLLHVHATLTSAGRVCSAARKGLVIGPKLAIGRAVGKSFGDCCDQCITMPDCAAFTYEGSEQQ